MLIAEYTNNKTLTISTLTGGYKINRTEIKVAGKREARKIAGERGATCWNF